jgi:hypothetical protein
MEKIVIEMLEAYLNGALKIEGDYSDSEHMRGWFAAMRSVKEQLQFEKKIFGLTPAE